MASNSAVAPVLASKAEYDATVNSVREAAQAYYSTGQVVMDDPTYDALMLSLRATEQAHPGWKADASPTDVVGTAAVSADKAVAHRTPMLSLDNIYERPAEADPFREIEDWVAGRNKALGRPVSAFTVEKKYDGSACSALYEDGRLVRIATRGDGTTGEDRSYAIDRIVNLPRQLAEPFTGEVRGEVLFRLPDYETAGEARIAAGKEAYSNPRNAAAGAFSAETLAHPVRLTFFPYSATGLEGQNTHHDAMTALRHLGFHLDDDAVAVCHTAAEVKAAVQSLAERRYTLDHEIDGAVIKADLISEQNELGLGSRAPRWGVAFKYPPDTAMAVLEEVTWNVGRTGVVAPRARITPTEVGGTVVTYSTLHNPADIARKGFLLHDVVMVKRAGEVIPRLEGPVVGQRDGTQVAIEIPQVCPRCDSELDKSQERWRCVRGRDCNKFATIRYGLERDAFYIKGVAGHKVVKNLVDAGLIADIADVFALTKEQFLTLPRMGETTATAYVERIEAAKAQPLSRVVTALGLRGTGRSLSRRIARHFGTMEAIRAASVADFEAVDGIGKDKAPSIVAELADLSETIDKLIAVGVNMTEPDLDTAPAAGAGDSGTGADGADPAGKPLAGMTVVVTGKMTGPLAGLARNEMNELIERHGGRSSDSVSAKTDLLVDGNVGKVSSKAAKAKALGKDVVTPDEFATMLGLTG